MKTFTCHNLMNYYINIYKVCLQNTLAKILTEKRFMLSVTFVYQNTL